MILKNCKAKVKISFGSTQPDDYGALLRSVYVAISADTTGPTPDAASNKSKTNISIMDGESSYSSGSALLLEIQSEDIPALRAALNSYLWLLDASINAYIASLTTGSFKPRSED